MWNYVYSSYEYYKTELTHHGITGQRWGKTYAQISNALQISESSVSNLISGKYR